MSFTRNIRPGKTALGLLLLAGGLALCQCRPIPLGSDAALAVRGPAPGGGAITQACSQEYAGELLAYFMQVVLGRAGRPELREEWRRRALDQPLDLDAITAILNGSGEDKSRLMVLDANLLAFSDVLYHYDPMLNQFKGRFAYHSPYPCPELIALRMLLLQKLHRAEKIGLGALLARRDLLLAPGQAPDTRALGEMNLSAAEFHLLGRVLQAAPQLFSYLHNPFLVDALAEIGAVRRDAFVSDMGRRANYRGIYPRERRCTGGGPGVTVAILPSMTKAFIPGPGTGTGGGDGFIPDEEYRGAAAAIIRGVLDRVDSRSRETAPGGRIEEPVRFFDADKRPLLVHPGNAERVLAELCPRADVAVILLGENVYRAVDIDPRRDTYPAANRFYLDIADVRHGQIEAELDQIAEAVRGVLKKRLAGRYTMATLLGVWLIVSIIRSGKL